MTGWRILEELQKNARVPFKQLAEKVNLSTTAVVERVKRMEEEGIIVDYRATLNPKKLGYSFAAILSLATKYGNPDPILKQVMAEIPEIISSWSITGTDDYLLEVYVPSLELLEQLLTYLTKYGKITTSIVLPSSISRRYFTEPRMDMQE